VVRCWNFISLSQTLLVATVFACVQAVIRITVWPGALALPRQVPFLPTVKFQLKFFNRLMTSALEFTTTLVYTPALSFLCILSSLLTGNIPFPFSATVHQSKKPNIPFSSLAIPSEELI